MTQISKVLCNSHPWKIIKHKKKIWEKGYLMLKKHKLERFSLTITIVHINLLHTITQTLIISSLPCYDSVREGDSSQSEGGQISLISLDLYKQSIPLKDEGRCSFLLPVSLLTSLSITSWMQMGSEVVRREKRRNVLSEKGSSRNPGADLCTIKNRQLLQ